MNQKKLKTPASLTDSPYPLVIAEGQILFPCIESADSSTWQLRIRLRDSQGNPVALTQEIIPVLFKVKAYDPVIAEIITDRTSKLGKVFKKADPVIVTQGVNIGKSNETTTLQQALVKAFKMHEKTLKSLPLAEEIKSQPLHQHEEEAIPIPQSTAIQAIADAVTDRAQEEPIAEEVKGSAIEEIKEMVESQPADDIIHPMLLGLYSYDKTGNADQPKNNPFPCFVQRKYDGLRCCAYYSQGRVVMQSRGQCEFTNLLHLQQEIASIFEQLKIKFACWDKFFLDGELYAHGASLQQLNSIIRSQDSDTSSIKMHVFDIAIRNPTSDQDWPFSRRLEVLRSLESQATPSLVFIETLSVDSPSDCKTLMDQFLSEGYEGAVLRKAEGRYIFSIKNKRSDCALKYKKRFDMEVTVLAFSEGNGKDSGAVIFSCQANPEQPAFNVVINSTLETRKAQFKYLTDHPSALDLLKTVPLQIEYSGLSSKGTPLQPRGVRFRFDLIASFGVQQKLLSQLFK